MSTLILAGLIQFTYIASRAFQQLNVMHHRIGMLYITSGIMAFCETAIWGTMGTRAYFSVESHGLTLQAIASFSLIFFPLWLGGSTGSHVAMNLHKWLRERDATK